MTHLTRRSRRSLRYEMSAFRAMVTTLTKDTSLSRYYERSTLPEPLEALTRTLLSFVPAMSPALRRQLFDLLGSGPWMEPPGVLFTLYEAALPELYPADRARRIGRSRKPYHVR